VCKYPGKKNNLDKFFVQAFAPSENYYWL